MVQSNPTLSNSKEEQKYDDCSKFSELKTKMAAVEETKMTLNIVTSIIVCDLAAFCRTCNIYKNTISVTFTYHKTKNGFSIRHKLVITSQL